MIRTLQLRSKRLTKHISMRTNCFLICFSVIAVFFSVNVKCESYENHKIVETNNGKVRGLLKTTLIKKVEYYSFKGIPYAKDPSGELRFKPPKPVESWSHILEAFEHGPICIQPIYPGLDNSQEQSENCLFLNIYVPADIKSNEKLAVMVYIHGGAYTLGSGNDDFNSGPDFLLEQRVIVVTLNYRLGVFGFMSFGTPEYSGNMGLKDQQLALKWVHSNIKHFSGDKKRITLFGVSAGSTSVHFQMFSEESRKYFRNAIPMSRSVDVYWALSKKGDQLDFAQKVASELGQKPNLSREELIDFFRSVPAEKMCPYGLIPGFRLRTHETYLSPVIERTDALQPFIVDLPRKLYETSDIDVDAIFSVCESEGITFYSKSAEEIYNLKGLDANFTLTLPFREADLPIDSPEYQQIAKEIRKFYFKDAPNDENTLKQYIDMLSDLNFAHGIYKSAKDHATKTKSKAYFLQFSVDSKLSVIKKALGSDLDGTGHGDDLCYVFRCKMYQYIYDDILKNRNNDPHARISLQTIESMTKLYANFAKYGEPTRDYDPLHGFKHIQGDRVNYLDVTNDGLKLGVNPNENANTFWARIEQKINKLHTMKRSREDL